MPVELSHRALSGWGDLKSVSIYVEQCAMLMLKALRREDAELSILLCDDVSIHALNHQYRGFDKPTDVLAFAIQEGPGFTPPNLLGDVVISLETAQKQAQEHSKTIAAELCFLLAHGLLHLLGFDHQNDEEERRMKALTDGLMAAARAVDNPEEN